MTKKAVQKQPKYQILSPTICDPLLVALRQPLFACVKSLHSSEQIKQNPSKRNDPHCILAGSEVSPPTEHIESP